MARENVRLTDGNFTSDGTYFYSMLDGSQVLQQKVDDGSVAFTYPLDTQKANPIKELEWDGVYFWSLETKGDGFIIRKWGIQSFICIQISKFEFTTGATHVYDADSFAIEHYRLTLGVNDSGGGNYTVGATDIIISDTSMLVPGDQLTFVRNLANTQSRVGTLFVEQRVVDSVLSATQVRLTIAMSGDPHSDGKGFRGPDVSPGGGEPPVPDLVFVTKVLWVTNKNAPLVPGTPALYKINSFNGSNLQQFVGTEYTDIGGCTFYAKYDRAGITPNEYNTTVNVDSGAGGRQTYVLLARDSSMLFFNTDTEVFDRSLVMNNIKADTIAVWPVFDMVIAGDEPDIVIYRLQLGTTFKNMSLEQEDETFSGGAYSYEKQILRRVVNSIAVVAEPSIIPADGSSTATITATLRDQYNDLIPSGKTVNWSDDSGENRVSPASSSTDSFGRALTTYSAGTVETDIKITAGVTNGLI